MQPTILYMSLIPLSSSLTYVLSPADKGNYSEVLFRYALAGMHLLCPPIYEKRTPLAPYSLSHQREAVQMQSVWEVLRSRVSGSSFWITAGSLIRRGRDTLRRHAKSHVTEQARRRTGPHSSMDTWIDGGVVSPTESIPGIP